MSDSRFSAAAAALGDDFADALREYYTLYSPSMIDWFAGLYDPAVGGYYYLNSARDTDGYLPDAESTVQALGFWESSGMASAAGGRYTDAIPGWMREQIGRFIYSLQDPDGYFYHPQWGKDIPILRRARDLNWCVGMLKAFGIAPKYPTIMDTKDGGGSESTLIPEHLSSREKFAAYLDSLNVAERSYHAGSYLTSQGPQLIACGLIDDAVAFLGAHQHPDTGHWHHTTDYYAVNGIMKITGVYNQAKAPIPHAREAAQAAIDAITSDQPMGGVVDLYNTWFAVSNIVANLRTCGGEDGKRTANEIVENLRRQAPGAIRKSKEKISAFRKPDGSFSYTPMYSSATSCGARAAVPKSYEGDVNATVISVPGTLGRAMAALELSHCKPHPFGEAERQYYISLLEAKR